MPGIAGPEILSKLLVVDDTPENLFAMETILKSVGAEIFTAQSGNEALSLMLRHDFALVLLDVQMPGMNGFELADLMHANEITRHIPIIFVTAISKEYQHVFKGYDSGAVDYLFKPLNSEILKQKVRVFLNLDRQKRLLAQVAGELLAVNESLKKARDELEMRVEERTADLNAATERMKRLSNYLRNMVDLMPSALVGVGPDGRVNQWNREAEKLVGLTADEAMGQEFDKICPRLVGLREKVWKAMRLRKIQRDEKITVSSDGETRYKAVTVYPLVTDRVEGAVIRVDDVTERVRIEEMVVQSEKMLSVGGLAAGMAHEINNPLAVILQNVQVMRNRLSGGLPKNVAVAEECGTTMDAIEAYMNKRDMLKMIDYVMDAGNRASKIVDNMLSFASRRKASITVCMVSDLLDKAVELSMADYDLKKKYDFRKMNILREYGPEPIRIQCEARKIQQVFLNVLKNATQALAEVRGEKRPEVTLRVLMENAMARIEIEDNGPGMNEEVKNRVFEPFFTTRETGGGTGLGLSVSYFIITENHGGTMGVTSTPGQGATFIICLPLYKDPAGLS